MVCSRPVYSVWFVVVLYTLCGLSSSCVLCVVCRRLVYSVWFVVVLCTLCGLSSSCVLCVVCRRPVYSVWFVVVLCTLCGLSSSCVLCVVCRRPVYSVPNVLSNVYLSWYKITQNMNRQSTGNNYKYLQGVKISCFVVTKLSFC